MNWLYFGDGNKNIEYFYSEVERMREAVLSFECEQCSEMNSVDLSEVDVEDDVIGVSCFGCSLKI